MRNSTRTGEPDGFADQITGPLNTTPSAILVEMVVGVVEEVTATVADWLDDPTVPVHVRVNVVFPVRFPVVWEPEIASVPDHPPEVVHELALVEDQVSVDTLPEMTEAGLAEMLTLGAGVDGAGVLGLAACL